MAQTYDNLDQLAGTLGTYAGAEGALFAIAGPLVGKFISLFFLFIEAMILAVMAWHVLKLDMRAATRSLLSSLVVMALAAPVQISVPKVSRETIKQQGPFAALAAAKPAAGGGMRFGYCTTGEGCISLSAAVYVVNWVSTNVMRLGMAAVDEVFVSAGKEPGSFSALGYQLINSDDQIETLARGSGLAEAMRIYKKVCPGITRADSWEGDAKVRPLTEEELAAVGLAEGKKIPLVEVNESARRSALRELAKWPGREGFHLLLKDDRNWEPRFKIESRSYWLGAVGDSRQAATYLIAPLELRSYKDVEGKEGVAVVPDVPEYFFPQSCAELYQTIQLGIQEFRAATEVRQAQMRAERNVADSYDSAGFKSTTALAKAVGGLQEAGGGSGLGAFVSKIPFLGWLGNMTEATGVMTLAKLVQGVSEFVGKYVLLIIPAGMAVAVFMAALYYPIVSLFALLPYQLERVGSVLWFIVWVKLSLLMIYVSLKLAGAVSLELARGEVVQTTGSATYALQLMTTVGAMILAIMSPIWARGIVFDDKHGLASSVSKFGGGVAAGAAMMAARPASRMVAMAAKPALKIAGAGLRGAGRLGAGAYRAWRGGTGLGETGRTTMKQVYERLGKKWK